MPELKNISWSHDAVIDVMIANPSLRKNQLAAMFHRSPAWMSVVTNSDAFKERLAERRGEVVDPLIAASLEERFRAVLTVSQEVVLESLHAKADAKVALQAMEISSRALGYGYKQPGTQVNVVVPVAVVPAKDLTTEQWSQTYAPGAPQELVDVEAAGSAS